MKINLHGPNGTRSLDVPAKQTAPTGPSPDPSAVHRKSCHACIRALRINEQRMWGCIKKHYQVESRSNLTVQQWAELSASLQAAKRDPQCREVFLKRIGYSQEIPVPACPVLAALHKLTELYNGGKNDGYFIFDEIFVTVRQKCFISRDELLETLRDYYRQGNQIAFRPGYGSQLQFALKEVEDES